LKKEMNMRTQEYTHKALVVDDGLVERLAGKAMLERLGFSVSMAASGEEALQTLRERPVDLVLCDITMPGMSGLALVEATRGDPQPPLFIMSTTHNDAEHAVASLRLGAYGYLTKPLRLEPLRATVTEALAKHRGEQNSARRDALTKLINKAEFSRCLQQRLQAATAGVACGAVLLVKVHGLNHVNHTYGRPEGDKLLQLAANALSDVTGPSDLLARVGEDLFALHLGRISHAEVEERARSLTEKAESAKMVIKGDAFSLSLMVGGACANGGMETEELLSRADFALHLARERSRNRIRIYSEADEVHKRELAHQLNTLTLVHAALDDGQRMAMHYQPIMDLCSGKVSHYEALLRLLDEDGKPCNTGELVKTCEVFGLIGRLDRAVVKACLEQVDRLPDGCGVAINLSGKSIGDPELLQFIETTIASRGIDPSRVIFELTETAAFYNLDEVRHFVRRIKSLGCRFALDDFGVGFSSFYYIKELDFDYLKLDGSFIANLPRNPNDQVFVRAMVEISKVFGLSVIAEWVEDQGTADMLRNFGVAYGQGYHFGKATPLAE
jgi:diguanylate cyclase (GGDEF)-like protein